MQKISANLWHTETENPAPGLTTRAYLWTRREGNVLFYNTTHPSDIDTMAELGGVAHQFLSHRDEIAPSLATIKQRFGSALHIHRGDAGEVTQTSVDDAFDRRHHALADLEVIPAPGHTPGSALYLATIDGRRHLFTGDTLLRNTKGEWWPGYLEGYSDRTALLATLDLMVDLDPDVVISSAFLGDSGVSDIAAGTWRAAVTAARRALAAGEQPEWE
ncbi:MBL fold metallo-hydrolase [Nocardia wallacei]|uniref:MBL fold metallo-hydrolase n=1 Tax=Nocardia wallacei TaxID=480035 RepID=UPI00245732EB|nr:MBL fold metallo-hydrolase [Nocardia wallacei]